MQSGHHASGLKLIPAIGRTSRWPQHSGPSSGGRRQRQDLNFITAADCDGASAGAAEGGLPGVEGKNGSDIQFLFYVNANRLFQKRQGMALFGRHKRNGMASLVCSPCPAHAMHVRIG